MKGSTLRAACAEGERPAILNESEGAPSRGDQTRVAGVLFLLTPRHIFGLLQIVFTESAPVRRFQ